MPPSDPSSPTHTVHHSLYSGIDPTNAELSAKNKRAFITGGGSPIGTAIAKAFVAAGAKDVAITGRTKAALLATKKSMKSESRGVTVTIFVADTTDQTAIENAFVTFSTVDILVHNAGYMPDLIPVKETRLEEWWRGFEINVKGSFIVTQAFLNVASPDATLVNVTAGLVHIQAPLPGYSSYLSSKLASAKFFQLVQQEHPAIRVIKVHPGVIQSPMLEKNGSVQAQDDGKQRTRPSADLDISMLTCFPAKLPASFIVWACSPDAAFLKGKFVWANWDVDELKARQAEIQDTDFLTLGLSGWPFDTALKQEG
ncbi:MAG: hypothetical protein LQ338_006098 [Usnochroma carphineum]|nr:MAG: hypothetical protein LQ338_006098 [Usnochroma carphineum]